MITFVITYFNPFRTYHFSILFNDLYFLKILRSYHYLLSKDFTSLSFLSNDPSTLSFLSNDPTLLSFLSNDPTLLSFLSNDPTNLFFSNDPTILSRLSKDPTFSYLSNNPTNLIFLTILPILSFFSKNIPVNNIFSIHSNDLSTLYFLFKDLLNDPVIFLIDDTTIFLRFSDDFNRKSFFPTILTLLPSFLKILPFFLISILILFLVFFSDPPYIFNSFVFKGSVREK